MKGDFRVSEHLVQPQLNRICSEGNEITVEPKVMEVLVCLARHPEEVMSKERILHTVWPDVFVTDTVLKRAIFELRRAFGDDVQNPSFIETIAKKGYRLIAPVSTVEELDSRYEIVQRLAQGGMGEVCLARDTALERLAVLKFPLESREEDEKARNRLVREAKTAAALDHPFICKIFETGELGGRTFIAMEYVEGETLKQRMARGPIPAAEALRIVSQVAEALEIAAERKIVHRDIKPSNIILTPKGRIKVTDFGVAQRLPEDGEMQDRTGVPTADFKTRGTLLYMSPEQLRGEEIDHRSDIFSLGTVLYEMLTGAHPFRTGSQSETISAILHESPVPMSLPVEDSSELLQHTVKKMLEKDPDDRYQSAHEVRSDFKRLMEMPSTHLQATPQPVEKSRDIWYGVGGVFIVLLTVALGVYLYRQAAVAPEEARIESIAILPFENVSGDQEIEYLCYGIPNSITYALTRLPNLRVVPSSSLQRYKDKEVDPEAVAKELGVHAVVAGRLLVLGDSLTLTVDLVDGRASDLIWGEQYQEHLSDILPLQEQMATRIAQELRLELTASEREQLAKSNTSSPAAYKAYLKGIYCFNQFYTRVAGFDEGMQRAIAFFNEAIDADPTYAKAYLGLARVFVALGRAHTDDEFFRKQRAAIDKALQLDDKLPEAHWMLARFHWNIDRDWVAAEREYRRAAELDAHCGPGPRVLMWMGRRDQAISKLEQWSATVDPISAASNAQLALSWLNVGEYDKAIEFASLALELDPKLSDAWFAVKSAYAKKGMEQEAFDAELNYEQVTGETEGQIEIYKKSYEASGLKGVWRSQYLRMIEKLEKGDPFVLPQNLAILCSYLEEKDEALTWLETTYALHITVPLSSSHFDNLRDQPRYERLLRKLNLSEEAIQRHLSLPRNRSR
jgi:serine/threonine protein kinase/DNA-binding winged helix-turn-helix (wHTH) protein/Tfp pilus assembly protein PilF